MHLYVRPDLDGIDPAELSDFLLGRGIAVKTELTKAGLNIKSDVDATAALDAFVPTSTLDRSTFPFRSDYKPKRPQEARLRAFLAAVEDDKIDLPELRRIVADVIGLLLRD